MFNILFHQIVSSFYKDLRTLLLTALKLTDDFLCTVFVHTIPHTVCFVASCILLILVQLRWQLKDYVCLSMVLHWICIISLNLENITFRIKNVVVTLFNDLISNNIVIQMQSPNARCKIYFFNLNLVHDELYVLYSFILFLSSMLLLRYFHTLL